ncbi:hypothetical protein Tco_0952355 [Tanacetum coccineum]|uniref:Uncharacterized protein n=1 Tax=Tanacetum coccineum TaxID=301880 RepID=A0ABQ5DWQ8_9ASTR
MIHEVLKVIVNGETYEVNVVEEIGDIAFIVFQDAVSKGQDLGGKEQRKVESDMEVDNEDGNDDGMPSNEDDEQSDDEGVEKQCNNDGGHGCWDFTNL